MKRVLIGLFILSTFNLFGQSSIFFNDNCGGMSQYLCNKQFSSLNFTGGTPDASDPIPSCGDGVIHKSKWFRIKSTVAGGNITVNIFNSNVTGGLSAAVYSGACGALTQVACNAGSGNFTLSFNAAPDTEYYLMMDIENGVQPLNGFGIRLSGNVVTNPIPAMQSSTEAKCENDTSCFILTNFTPELPNMTYGYNMTIDGGGISAPPSGSSTRFCTNAVGPHIVRLNASNGCFTNDPDIYEFKVYVQEIVSSITPSGPFCPEKNLDSVWTVNANLSPAVSSIDFELGGIQWTFTDCGGAVLHSQLITDPNQDSIIYNVPVTACKPVHIKAIIYGTCGPDSTEMDILYYAPLELTTTLSRDTACVLDIKGGNPVTATTNITAGAQAPPYRYTWAGPATFTPAVTTTTNTFANMNITSAVVGDNQYTVMVRDSNGCTARDTVMLNVRKDPKFIVDFSNNLTTNCYGTGYNVGDTVTATITITDGTPNTQVHAILLTNGITNTTLDTTYFVSTYPSAFTRDIIIGTNEDVLTLSVMDGTLPTSSCKKDTSISVNILPVDFVATAFAYPLHCQTSTTPIDLCVTGVTNGTGNFTYNWSGPGTYTDGGQCINVTGLTPGIKNYTVTVADGACDTTIALTIRIKGDPLVTGSYDTTNISRNCAGAGFQHGDLVTYYYTIDSISTPTRVTINLPGVNNTFVVNTAPYSDSVKFVYDSTLTNIQGTIFVVDTLIQTSACKTTFNVDVTELPKIFKARASTPRSIYCTEDINSVQLNVSYNINPQNPVYSWTPAGSLNNATIRNPQMVSGLTPGNYTYQVNIKDNFCDTTMSVNFTLKDTPTLVINSIKGTLDTNCAGSGYVRGSTVTYYFTIDNILNPAEVTIDLPGTGNDRTFNITSAPYIDSASFVVTTATNYGSISVVDVALKTSTCVATTSMNITPLPNVLNATISGNSTVCKLDNSVTSVFAGATQGVQPYTYVWTGPSINGSTTSNFINVNVAALAAGTYTYQVVIKDDANCEETMQFPLSVTTAPVITHEILTPMDTNCAGTGYRVGDTVRMAYRYTDGIITSQVALNFPGQSGLNSTFYVREATYADTINVVILDSTGVLGTVSVVDSSNASSQCKGNYQFTLPILPKVLAAAGMDSTYCGVALTDSILVCAAGIRNAVGSLSYQWTTTGGNPLPSNTTTSCIYITGLAVGGPYPYSVTITDQTTGCDTTVTYNVSLSPVPTYAGAFTTALQNVCGRQGYCEGQTVNYSFTVSAGAAPYFIAVNTVGGGTVNYTSQGDTTIVLTFTVGADTNAAHIVINDQNTLTKCAIERDVIFPLVDFSSTGVVSNITCTSSIQQGYIAIPVDANCTNLTYDWSTSPAVSLITSGLANDTASVNLQGLTSGTYNFTARVNGDGCIRAYDYVLNYSSVNFPATISSGINPTILCKGDLPYNTYAIQVQNVNGINYDWTSSSANALAIIPSAQLNSSTIIVDFANTLANGDYVFNVVARAGTSGCDTTLSYTVKVVDTYKVEATISDSVVCANKQVTVRASGGAGNNYIWSVNGTSISNTSNTLDYSDNAGTYEFVIKDQVQNSCNITDSISLLVNPIPVPKIISSLDTVTCHESTVDPVIVTYSFSVEPANVGVPDSVIWKFFDETVVTNPSIITKSYELEGTYPATLKVIYNGCVGETALNIKVCDGFYVPNVFTPNGDGTNEEFFVRGVKGNGWRLDIFNRWGNPVYSTTNYKNDWKGDKVSEGVYYYNLISPDGTKDIKGWVQVIK